MASNNEEEKHICRYAGPSQEDSPRYTELQPLPPSPDFAQTTALAVLGGRLGRYRPTLHCRNRMIERDFDVFDVEYVIRHGKCVGNGIFVEENKHHKYTFRGSVDGVEFDAVIGLSSEHDLFSSPLLILITGVFKTRTGKRSKT